MVYVNRSGEKFKTIARTRIEFLFSWPGRRLDSYPTRQRPAISMCLADRDSRGTIHTPVPNFRVHGWRKFKEKAGKYQTVVVTLSDGLFDRFISPAMALIVVLLFGTMDGSMVQLV